MFNFFSKFLGRLISRRDFNLATTSIAVSLVCTPVHGDKRWTRIGYGIDPATDRVLHEEFKEEEWDNDSLQWKDTRRRKDWWVDHHGRKREHLYVLVDGPHGLQTMRTVKLGEDCT